ncbi:MAG: glycoside hydrolase family 5 protein [Prevotellaceae bacterium]|nr:glycoside hydrolase family 5 protein [Prevotellaceae bacterium]
MKNLLYAAMIALVMLASCEEKQAGDDGFASVTTTVEPTITPHRAPFSKGINLTWFEREVDILRALEHVIHIKRLGADVIRLPLDLFHESRMNADYSLNPFFLKQLRELCVYAEREQIYLILDNHSLYSSYNALNGGMPPLMDELLVTVWTQLAEVLKDRGRYIIYEILNEPYVGSWYDIQAHVINAIREIDPHRTVVVDIGDIEQSSAYANLQNLIYSVHYYAPFLFTHQGAWWSNIETPSWTWEPMKDVKGIPWPPDATKMPSAPSAKLEPVYERYVSTPDNTPNAMAEEFNVFAKWSQDHSAPVFCGEYGVYMKYAPHYDRVRWYDFVSGELDRRGISRTSWEYFDTGFGPFQAGSSFPQSFYADLDNDIVKAMRFTPPVSRRTQTITGNFPVYEDYLAQDVYFSKTTEDFDGLYSADRAAGEHAILWKNVPWYLGFSLNFVNNINWQDLKNNGYSLEFRAKTDMPEPVRFDVRFKNEGEIEWLMRQAVSVPAAGAWHTITVPLNKMGEQGAAKPGGGWLAPNGEFSWSKIRSLEFIAEYGTISGTMLIDEIKIIAPNN